MARTALDNSRILTTQIAFKTGARTENSIFKLYRMRHESCNIGTDPITIDEGAIEPQGVGIQDITEIDQNFGSAPHFAICLTLYHVCASIIAKYTNAGSGLLRQNDAAISPTDQVGNFFL